MKNLNINYRSTGVWNLILILTVIAGCGLTDSSDNPVFIRIGNESSHTIENITVQFPEKEIDYGDLLSGVESSYEEVSKAYRYAYIEAVVDGKEVVLQPIDYVGESLLDPGKYTYNLGLNEEMFNSDDYRFSLLLELVEN